MEEGTGSLLSVKAADRFHLHNENVVIAIARRCANCYSGVAISAFAKALSPATVIINFCVARVAAT